MYKDFYTYVELHLRYYNILSMIFPLYASFFFKFLAFENLFIIGATYLAAWKVVCSIVEYRNYFALAAIDTRQWKRCKQATHDKCSLCCCGTIFQRTSKKMLGEMKNVWLGIVAVIHLMQKRYSDSCCKEI